MDMEQFDPEEWELEGFGEQKPPKRKSDFARGMAAGVMVTVLAAAALTLALRFVVAPKEREGLAAEPKEGQAEEEQRVFDSSVEKKMSEIADLIDEYYYEAVDKDAMAEGVYAGMVSGLGDPYSNYFTAEEYASFHESTSGLYFGIGVVLNQDAKTKVITVRHVYPGTPAEEAGMKDGDILAQVKDLDISDMELAEVVTHIKGEEGSTVHLRLIREGEADYVEMDVERRQIEVPTVQYQMLEGDIGFIQISEFAESTPEQFEEAITEMQGNGMKSMIVDLRDNPGGVLQSVCTMLDDILPEGLVVYTEDKYGNRSDYKSDKECMDIPMAVLINENSASASEIFAGAVKDYGYGTLIGTKSFGKGSVQTIIPLQDGSAVKVTMAKYFTPKGNYIHEVGIAPDIELEYKYLEESDETYNPMHDNQVQKAIEVLQQE